MITMRQHHDSRVQEGQRALRANELSSQPVATPTENVTSTIDTSAVFPRSSAIVRKLQVLLEQQQV